MIKFGVTIICENEVGTFAHNYIETDSLVGVARMIHTFKPKKGYQVVKIMVDQEDVLDLDLQRYGKNSILEVTKGL